MPTLQEQIDTLTARLDRIEQIPKISAQLGHTTWPRPMSFGEGTITPVNEAALAIPKTKALLAAEAAEAEAQVSFEQARQALGESQYPGRSPEDPYQDLFRVDLATPLGQAMLDAERRLIRARVKVFELSRKREADMTAWDKKRNEELAGIASKSPVERVRRAFGSR